MHGYHRNYIIWICRPGLPRIHLLLKDRTGAFRLITGKEWLKILFNGGKTGSPRWRFTSMPSALTISWDFSEFGVFHYRKQKESWGILNMPFPCTGWNSMKEIFILIRTAIQNHLSMKRYYGNILVQKPKT